MPTLNKTTIRYQDNAGVRRRRVVIYTGPASYATGGDAFTASDVSLGQLEFAPNAIAHSGTATRLLAYDYTNAKYLWYVPNTGAEVAATTDLSAFTVRLEVAGK